MFSLIRSVLGVTVFSRIVPRFEKLYLQGLKLCLGCLELIFCAGAVQRAGADNLIVL